MLGPHGGTRLALTAFATGTNCQIDPAVGNYDCVVACRRAQTASPPCGPARANPHPAAPVMHAASTPSAGSDAACTETMSLARFDVDSKAATRTLNVPMFAAVTGRPAPARSRPSSRWCRSCARIQAHRVPCCDPSVSFPEPCPLIFTKRYCFCSAIARSSLQSYVGELGGLDARVCVRGQLHMKRIAQHPARRVSSRPRRAALIARSTRHE